MTVISKAGRQALIAYKYQSTLKGWLDSNIMNDFWEKVVSFFPLFVAPNVITFAATIQFLTSTLIFSTYCPDLRTCLEPWVYYMMAASLFIYQTLDAIDGKQARRTKQSSPLGQLFDHGNDAFILTSILSTSFAVLQYGPTWQFLFMLMNVYLVFFMLNWRARHVGMMHFGVFSVTETQLIVIAIYIFSGVLGCSIWNTQLIGTFDVKTAVIGGFVLTSMYTLYEEYAAVQQYYKNGKEDPGQIYELLHMALFVTALVCWNLCDVFTDYPWTFLWISTFVFCGIIHRLIVADVTHMKTTKYYHLLDPLLLMICGSLIEYVMKVEKTNSVMNSPFMIYGILVYVVIFWSSFVFKVIDEICETLDIKLFVVNPPKKKTK